MKQAPFLLHRLALRPLIGTAAEENVPALVEKVARIGIDPFFEFLHTNGLSQLWRACLSGQDLSAAFDPVLAELRKGAIVTAANQLKQKRLLHLLDRVLDAAGIDYFIFKGANLRETIYDDPTHRPVSDIDLFVREQQKFDAVRLLVEEGYALYTLEETVSHEVSLVQKDVTIDLHWHLLRPGRTRIDLAEWLFDNRETFGGLRGLNRKASLLVMLIHPAITKHLVSPDSMLIHMVDLVRLQEISEAEWCELSDVLGYTGMRSAAWSSLYLLHHFTGLETALDRAFQLQPGLLHRRYIQYWIEHDLVRRLFHHRMLVRSLFDLALQDGWRDAVHAVLQLKREKKMARQQAEMFDAVAASFVGQC
jgi:Uncharacterised nucleotidyltransferase